MANDYAELIRRVPEWLYAQNRTLVDEMPAIVSQAHDQLINILDHDLFKTLILGKTLTSANNGVLDLSSETPRVLEVRAVRLKWRGDDDWTPLQRRDLETLTMMFARNMPRRPRYYSEYSGTLVLKAFPAPDRDYDLEITANVEPPVLSPTVQTNIMTEQAFRAVEKATMRQAAIFMKDWESAQLYEKEMATAVGEVNAAIQRRRRDAVETRPVETSNVSGA
jgi:hypothetical protein